MVWHRGRIMQRATGLGRMTSVGLERGRGGARDRRPRRPAVRRGRERGAQRGAGRDRRTTWTRWRPSSTGARVAHRRLPVTYAFHAAQMEPLRRELEDVVGAVEVSPARVAVHSTVTGGPIDHRGIDTAYFGRNVRQPVRFADALGSMAADGVDVVVELAPHPVLTAAITDVMDARGLDVPVVASMRRDHPGRETMLEACAGVYAAGGAPAWPAVTGRPDVPVDLPSYPWQRRRYWHGARRTAPPACRRGVVGGRPRRRRARRGAGHGAAGGAARRRGADRCGRPPRRRDPPAAPGRRSAPSARRRRRRDRDARPGRTAMWWRPPRSGRHRRAGHGNRCSSTDRGATTSTGTGRDSPRSGSASVRRCAPSSAGASATTSPRVGWSSAARRRRPMLRPPSIRRSSTARCNSRCSRRPPPTAAPSAR